MTPHKLHIFLKVQNLNKWVTVNEIVDEKVKNRTVRQHAKDLVEEGLFARAKSFDGYRYSVADDANLSEINKWIKIYGMRSE